ncbi:MAG: hypothetical protein KBC27_00690 [Rickettsiales bacterium]|nr:hypothetical protein [Rickettsiales bacterium]
MENILQISSFLSQYILLLLPLSLFSSALISFALIFIFKKLNILDVPNTRSNHKTPIPVGGGIAIVITTLWTLFLTFFNQTTESQIKYLFLSIIIIAFISFIDDLKSLKVRTRIPFHIIAIILLLKSLLFPQHDIYMFITLIVGIFFFINFYNFMDGIDGSAASEAIHIGMSIILLYAFDSFIPQELLIVSLVLVGASLGFAIFNWHPAQIFLGDVGSISLGVICAWLLLNLALYKYLAAAIIIPLYYIADSTLTITKRLLQGKKIWQAHSEHFFQKAVRKGLSHAKVTRKIILINFILCILSIISIYYPILALTASLLVVGMLLYHFQKA